MNISFLFLASVLSERKCLDFRETASLIANSEFLYRKITSIVWWQVSDQVDDYLLSYQGSVKTIDMNFSFNQSIALEQAILFVTSTEEFLEIAMNLDKKITSPGKVVTILSNPNELSDITKVAWKYDIADLIILTKENQTVSMYTYYPYSNNECGSTAPVKVDFKKKFFPRKFKNLFGCETRLGSVTAPPYSRLECVNGSSPSYKGILGSLVKLIVDHMNTTLKVLCILGTDQKMINDLEHKTVHILTSVIYTQDFLATQNTPVYHFFESVWCGPPQREMYTHVKVLVPMLSNFTVFLCATYLILVAVLKIIDRLIREPRNKTSHMAWKAFAVLLGQSFRSDSKYWLINYLFMLWFWFSLVYNIAYQGLLVTGLQTKYLEPRFDNIKHAISLVDGYGGTIRQRILYNDTPIFDKYQVMELHEMFSYLSPISRGKRFLILTVKLVLLGYKSLQIFQEVNHVPMTMSLTPRWGGGVEIISTQTRLIEGGFFEKILVDEKRAIESREAKLRVSSDFQSGHLDFKTLCTCFYGLGVMSVVCFVIFLIELLYHRLVTPAKGKLMQNLDNNKLHAS
ncbi:uncharacterized protein LOC133528087 [Cydia pomonella]|uniref:uncharacterized protein LOC133528087 n=1 Tax=Cydia pomonella TaxID=82600 RepID=UPI002ADDAD09|nr:uncharacterized protein LOC133528087 [Cydia pomonella]